MLLCITNVVPVGGVADLLVLFELVTDHLQELVRVSTEVLHETHQILDGLLDDHSALEKHTLLAMLPGKDRELFSTGWCSIAQQTKPWILLLFPLPTEPCHTEVPGLDLVLLLAQVPGLRSQDRWVELQRA